MESGALPPSDPQVRVRDATVADAAACAAIYAPYAARGGAYRWTCTTSVYLETGRRRTGAGRALYTALPDRLTALGYRQAVAVYTEPNPASAGLHAALGFEVVGTLRGVGHKHGAWRDVTLAQRTLGDGSATPPADPPGPADAP